jgi:hypothetical protein
LIFIYLTDQTRMSVRVQFHYVDVDDANQAVLNDPIDRRQRVTPFATLLVSRFYFLFNFQFSIQTLEIVTKIELIFKFLSCFVKLCCCCQAWITIEELKLTHLHEYKSHKEKTGSMEWQYIIYILHKIIHSKSVSHKI